MTTDSSSTSQTPSQPAVPAATPVAASAAPVPVEPVAAVAAPPPVEAAPIEAVKPVPAEVKPAAVAALPEAYTVTLPEGMKVDAALVPALTPAFKKAGMTQEGVNELVTTFAQYQAQQPARMLARDLEATMKDPLLGGMNWGRTQGAVNEALGAFTTPQFRQKLERWGIANDLEFVRVFASIGQAMRGDVAERGSPATVREESRADRLYGRAAKPN